MPSPTSTTTPLLRHLLRQAPALSLRARPTTRATPVIHLRHSSTGGNPPAQKVLAKPERFTPPSHGSRLPRKQIPRHYGGDLSADEKAAQQVRDYPFMPPPPGSKADRILNNRWIHVAITVGTLTSLAIYTFTLNFQRTSPFADLLPSSSDFLSRPIDATRTLFHVIRLHEAHKAERIAEKREQEVLDVGKRRLYRRAHGLPEEMGLFNQPMAKIKGVDPEVEEGDGAKGQGKEEAGEKGVEEGRRKWFGIF